jgi:hypothetical protein
MILLILSALSECRTAQSARKLDTNGVLARRIGSGGRPIGSTPNICHLGRPPLNSFIQRQLDTLLACINLKFFDWLFRICLMNALSATFT